MHALVFYLEHAKNARLEFPVYLNKYEGTKVLRWISFCKLESKEEKREGKKKKRRREKKNSNLKCVCIWFCSCAFLCWFFCSLVCVYFCFYFYENLPSHVKIEWLIARVCCKISAFQKKSHFKLECIGKAFYINTSTY